MLKCGDVLASWEEGNLLDEEYHLVANLPYYIANSYHLKSIERHKVSIDIGDGAKRGSAKIFC